MVRAIVSSALVLFGVVVVAVASSGCGSCPAALECSGKEPGYTVCAGFTPTGNCRLGLMRCYSGFLGGAHVVGCNTDADCGTQPGHTLRCESGMLSLDGTKTGYCVCE